MEKILHRIEHGEGRPGDVDLLLHMGTNIFGRTICPLGDAGGVAGGRVPSRNSGPSSTHPYSR